MGLVTNWLSNESNENKFEVYNNSDGKYDLENNKIIQNSGSIHSIWIKIDSDGLKQLASNYKNNAIKIQDYYILYFGKDIHLGERFFSHLNTSVGTGGIDLKNKSELHNFDL